MNTEHFLAWLHVADLEATGDEGLRIIFEQVLEDAPEDPGQLLDRLLDELEDQLDADSLDHKRILAWPKSYAALLGQAMEPLKEVEEELEAMAEELPQSQVESPRLALFQSCLDKLSQATSKRAMADAWSELATLESEIAQAHAEYSAEGFTPEAVSAESVAGHRFLEDGFACWFEAFDLAKMGQARGALAAANEGNRLFRAVAQWSDEVAGT